MADRDVYTMTLKQTMNAYEKVCNEQLELIAMKDLYQEGSLEHDRIMEKLHTNKDRVDDILGYMKMIASSNKESMDYVAKKAYPLMDKVQNIIATKKEKERVLGA